MGLRRNLFLTDPRLTMERAAMTSGLTFIVSALLIVTLTGATGGQNGSVTGKVTDTGGYVVPGVSVTIVPFTGGPPKQVTTNKSGAYEFEALEDGRYYLLFQLVGFQPIRWNNVHVSHGRTVEIDTTLQVGAICECVKIVSKQPLAERMGQVLDESGHPIPYAKVTVTAPMQQEVAYTTVEGHFRVRLPTKGEWQLTASSAGYRPVTLKLSGRTKAAIQFRLQRDVEASVPEMQNLATGCRCGDLFTHEW